MGTLNWRQVGRSHDAAVLQFQDSTFRHIWIQLTTKTERNSLGFSAESDSYFTRELYKNVTLTGGYLHIFARKSTEIRKADNHGALADSSKNIANWVWLEISLKPTFLSAVANVTN